MKIIDIEGIGPKYGEKLSKAGIDEVEDLIGLSKDKLKEISKETGISVKLIDEWQEHADLMRLHGVGPEYSDLLNEIGIDSVKELAQRNPENTLKKIEEHDKEQPDTVRKIPSLESIKKWIEEAKKIK
ncbi:DUF4332 domain-containing protein [Candidatus Bathyarchaeota archaeon]|nr:DUF4332 domain-containing protein [Candidatus Bathyarchaeota archaeon]